MAKEPKISVVLTEEGRELLAASSIQLLLSKGIYFNCESVEQNGYFLDMKIFFNADGDNKLAVVSIPYHYVKYMVSAESSVALGFGGSESTSQDE